jgi:hypothetical protein
MPHLDLLTRWRNDAGLFAREVFKMEPDLWQDKVFDAYSGKTTNKKRICMRACKGPGKTALEAICGLHFLTMYPFPKIAATAITGDNLRDNLWAEFKKWMRRSDWIMRSFTWTKERIFNNDHPEEWWISARKWSKDADPEQQANTLAGLHAEYLLFILDEAGGIPDSVAAAAEGGLATGTLVKLLIGGNPTHSSGPLYRACTSERDLWWVQRITADPDDPNRTPRVSAQWAREQIRKYGRKSVWVMTNVLGEFPKGAIDSVLSMEWLEDAFNRWGMPYGSDEPRVLGCDIARYGNDLTVICKRRGWLVPEFNEWQGESTQVTAKRIRAIYDDEDYEEIRIDDVGVGGGVTDRLLEFGLNVIPVNVGEAPIDDEENHMNLRSELYHDLQDVFAEGEIHLHSRIREDTTLVAEGTTLKTEFNDRNKRRIEPKDKYRKRTGRSPNYLDALLLAFADRVAMKSAGASGEVEEAYRGMYNPYTKEKVRPDHHRIWNRRLR